MSIGNIDTLDIPIDGLAVAKLRGDAKKIADWMGDNKKYIPSEDITKFEKIEGQMQSVQQELEGQKIFAAQQALMSVKGQLEALRNPKHPNAELERAIASLSSIHITDASSADNASTLVAAGAQVAQAEAGGEIQQALGDVVLGAASFVVAGAEKFGSLLGLDAKAMQGFKTIASTDAGLQVQNPSEKMLNTLVANFTGNAPARSTEQRLG